MDVFEFVTPEEMDELPDDATAAFLTVVQLAQGRLRDRERELGGDDDSWREIEDSRYSFMNFVVAAGRRFEIEPFMEMQVPQLAGYDYAAQRQFKADLDHYVTQMLLDSSLRRKRDSVPLTEDAKGRVRRYILGIRECIDKSGFDDAKRSALHDKLSKFEAELERRRLSLLAVTRVVIEIMAVPGALWATGDVTAKLVSNILHEVGEAKAADDASRELPPVEKPTALIPPRKEELEYLDDEIPF